MRISRADTRTFIVLLAIILVLSLYLAFRGGDRVRYELPQLPELDRSDIDGMDIALAGSGGNEGAETVRLRKSGTRWLIEPQGHKADPGIVEEMVLQIAALNVTDLVSTTGAGEARYGLDAGSRVAVKALRGDDVVREIYVGERAATYHHTYVSLPGDDRVFYAEGSLRSMYARGGEELRDRVVLAVRKSDISSIEVRRQEGTFTIRPRAAAGAGPQTGGAASPAEGSGGAAAEAAKSASWETSEGVPIEREELGQAVGRLASLSCMRYMEEKPRVDPVLELVIDADGEKHTLAVYPRDGGTYPATSSDSEDPFQLATVVGEALLNGFALTDPAEDAE
jgi:hypothetical protein